jgi:DNA-binding transcriptional regulator YiaG
MTTKSRLDVTAAINARIQARTSNVTAISLADWREKYGLTQQGLASTLGINLYTVKKWEGGDRKPINFLGLALASIVEKLAPTSIDNSNTENFLQNWRKVRGMTQEALAAELGVNLFTIKKWEGGSRRSIDFLGLALSALDADLVPVKIKFERRTSLEAVENLEVQPRKPF